jgi:hypothetical protein
MSRLQRWCCYVLLVLGLGVALYSCWLKLQADRDYRQVTVLVDWNALHSLPDGSGRITLTDAPGRPPDAAGSDADVEWELLSDHLPGAYLCYGEETVGTLLDQGIFLPAGVTTGAPAFAVADPRLVRDISHGAARHGYAMANNAATGNRLVVQFPALPQEDLNLLPVAWLSSVITAAQQHGVPLILRPGGSEFLGENGISRTLDYCHGQPLVLFEGPTVLGYPFALDQVAGQLADQQQFFGWVEFDEQDGGAQLAARLKPQVVRVHSIPPEEMVNYGVSSAVARYLRAVRERNIRCIYLRPFIRGDVISSAVEWDYKDSLITANQSYFGKFGDELTAAGFSISKDLAAPKDPPDWLARVRPLFSTLAAGAAFILLLALWLTGWPRWVWWFLLAATVLKSVAAIYIPLVDTGVLLATALVFPLLGFWLALALYQRLVQPLPAGHILRLGAALLALVVASLVTMLGGLLIHGGMWDSATMLKVTQFRGVTVALGLPILLLAAYAWQAETLQDAYDRAVLRLADYWQRFITLWQAPIRYGDVAFIFIALGAIGIVLLRSGNESPLGVLSVESWFRDGLEQWFAVRPRTKELIGHPLFVIFLMSLPWRNRLSLLFALAALLGQVSILNTFCHLHTPLAVTVERVLLGLGLGLISGLLWGLALLVITGLWRRLSVRFARRPRGEQSVG